MDYDFEKLNDVWARVTGANEDSVQYQDGRPADAEKIGSFITDAEELSVFYSEIAHRCRTKSQILRRLAAEEKDAIRRLQTAHFLLTGDTCPVSKGPSVQGSTLDALREAYMAENDTADAYRSAAISSGNGSVTDLFSALSERASDHAATLRDIIAECMS